MYMSCLLICCIMCKKAIEQEIKLFFSFVLYGLVVGQNINTFFCKTEKHQVRICSKIPENCRLFGGLGPFQFSSVSLTIAVISSGVLTLSEKEIKT